MKLLNNIIFIKSLVGCALEVVLFCWGGKVGGGRGGGGGEGGKKGGKEGWEEWFFPFLLSYLGVSGFEFFKIIESLVREVSGE